MSLWHKPKHPVAVVIPVHRDITDLERISLEQCIRVLGKHPMFFVAPEGLSTDGWHSLDHGKKINVVNLDDSCFSTYAGYNAMLLSFDFYRRFMDFRHILVYQLDSFVFRDELLQWCAADYDYIGAPWVEATPCYRNKIRHAVLFLIRSQRMKRWLDGKVRWVGNGGFSLRNVKRAVMALTVLRWRARKWVFNEDRFWGIIAPGYLPFFRIPPRDVALKFSFELEPASCFERNNRQLPFGCHAWWTHEREFWRPIFKDYGYEI